jgi:hypothetical protein
MNRFFRITDPVAYEAVRLELNEQWNMPLGESVYAPLAEAPLDTAGRILLGILAQHCELPDIAAALAEMDARGWGEEISEADYWSSVPSPVSP